MVLMCVSVSCFGVRVFDDVSPFMFVYYFSSAWVTEWPLCWEKSCPHGRPCVLVFVYLYFKLFPVLVLMAGFFFYCSSSWSLKTKWEVDKEGINHRYNMLSPMVLPKDKVRTITIQVVHVIISCIPDEKIQVNLDFWSGSEILVWPWCSDPPLNTGCNGRHVSRSLTDVTRASGNYLKKTQNGWRECVTYFKVKMNKYIY